MFVVDGEVGVVDTPSRTEGDSLGDLLSFLWSFLTEGGVTVVCVVLLRWGVVAGWGPREDERLVGRRPRPRPRTGDGKPRPMVGLVVRSGLVIIMFVFVVVVTLVVWLFCLAGGESPSRSRLSTVSSSESTVVTFGVESFGRGVVLAAVEVVGKLVREEDESSALMVAVSFAIALARAMKVGSVFGEGGWGAWGGLKEPSLVVDERRVGMVADRRVCHISSGDEKMDNWSRRFDKFVRRLAPNLRG